MLLDFPDVVTQILPELGPAVGFDQRNPHHRWDVYTHSVKTAALVPPSPALRLAALLHDVGKPASFFLDERGIGHFYGHDRLGVPLAERAMARLRLDNATRERAAILISRHHLPVEPTRRWAGRWLSRLGEECFFQLLALKGADASACAPPLKAEESAPLERAEALGRPVVGGKCLSFPPDSGGQRARRPEVRSGRSPNRTGSARAPGLCGPGRAAQRAFRPSLRPGEVSFPIKKSAHASVWADFFMGFIDETRLITSYKYLYKGRKNLYFPWSSRFCVYFPISPHKLVL